jgi:alpha-tubulin suppressor-like RCC1 family protein
MRRLLGVASLVLAACGLAACGDATGPRPSPEPTSGRALALGGRHGCRLAADGQLRCWGRADAGQMGTGTTPLRSPVVTVSAGTTRFASVAAGGLHSCALTEDGQAWCWGENSSGQAGFPLALNQVCGEPIHGWRCVPTPRALETSLRFEALVAGGANTCGFTGDGEVYCWGTNAAGQLAAETTESCDGASCSHVPLPLPSEPRIRTLALGTAAHLCGLTADGVAYCWGSNAAGQLGLGTPGGSRDVPSAVTGGLRFSAITVGGEHTCALDGDGKPWCWGRDILPPNAQGSSFSPAPVAIADSPALVELITGTWAACGRTGSGSVYCWGINAFGEMGISPSGLNTRYAVPQLMSSAQRWTMIAGSWATFCGLDDEEGTWCWGHGADGELVTPVPGSTQPIPINGV